MGKHSLVQNISEDRVKVLVEIDRFYTSLDDMHKEEFDKSSKSLQVSVDGHNRKRGVKKIVFWGGDFVLKVNPLKNIP